MDKKTNGFKLFIWVVFVVYIFALIYVVVFKNGLALHFYEYFKIHKMTFKQKLAGANFIPFKTITYYLSGEQGLRYAIRNVAGNIIVFLPMGFLLPMLLVKYKRICTFLIAFLCSFSIETVQLVFSLGSCDVDDIILNLIGTCIGFMLYNKLLHKQQHYENEGNTIFNKKTAN